MGGLPAHHVRLVRRLCLFDCSAARLLGGNLVLSVVLRSVIHNRLRIKNVRTRMKLSSVAGLQAHHSQLDIFVYLFDFYPQRYSSIRDYDRLGIKIVQMFRTVTKLPSVEGLEAHWHHSRQLDIYVYLTFAVARLLGESRPQRYS